MRKVIFWLILFVFVLTSCAPAQVATPVPTITALPSATSPPTATATPTPVPTATATTTSSPTPTVTSTPRPQTLRDLADARNFRIGTFYMAYEFERITALQEREFNLAGIYVGMTLTQPNPGEFHLNTMIGLANRAIRVNREVLIHPLIWAGDVPDWLKNGSFSRDELIEIMKTHIRTLMRPLSGKKAIFVVVNEAYIEGDVFRRVIGDDYVDIAFQTARETDPSAILIYNDYNNHSPVGEFPDGERTQLSRDIVERLQAKGLVDGIGLQMHLDGLRPPSKEEVIATMRSYGLPVYVTEFDVNLRRVKGNQERRFDIQAEIYKEMLEACLESTVCHHFVVFQTVDKYSVWETMPNLPFYSADADPTPFDDDFQPKSAYFAMWNALSHSK